MSLMTQYAHVSELWSLVINLLLGRESKFKIVTYGKSISLPLSLMPNARNSAIDTKQSQTMDLKTVSKRLMKY